VAIIIVFVTRNMFVITGEYPVKNKVVKRLTIKIFAYSAMKISANRPLLYSILNPETNSDSPSAKSNGVRFVSARFVIYHIIKIGLIINIIHEYK